MITFESLKSVQREERRSNKLAKLNPGFYSEVKDYIESKRKFCERARKEGLETEIHELELKNAEDVLNDIYDRRERKIVQLSLSSVRSGLRDAPLLKEEKEMFDSLIEILEIYRGKMLSSVLSRHPIEKVKKVKIDRIKVKFSQDFPAFIGTDSKEYGPFRAEEIVDLPKANARILIKKGKAVETK